MYNSLGAENSKIIFIVQSIKFHKDGFVSSCPPYELSTHYIIEAFF